MFSAPLVSFCWFPSYANLCVLLALVPAFLHFVQSLLFFCAVQKQRQARPSRSLRVSWLRKEEVAKVSDMQRRETQAALPQNMRRLTEWCCVACKTKNFFTTTNCREFNQTQSGFERVQLGYEDCITLHCPPQHVDHLTVLDLARSHQAAMNSNRRRNAKTAPSSAGNPHMDASVPIRSFQGHSHQRLPRINGKSTPKHRNCRTFEKRGEEATPLPNDEDETHATKTQPDHAPPPPELGSSSSGAGMQGTPPPPPPAVCLAGRRETGSHKDEAHHEHHDGGRGRRRMILTITRQQRRDIDSILGDQEVKIEE